MAIFVYPKTLIKFHCTLFEPEKIKISFKNTPNKDHQHVGIQFRIRDLKKIYI